MSRLYRPPTSDRWLDRNVKWVVPLAVVALIGVGALGLYGFLRWFDGRVRSLPPYRMALQQLRVHRDAARFLGQPIEAEGQIQGNLSTTNRSSTATFRVPVQGPRHEGVLHVSATAVGESWTLESVVLTVQQPQRRFVILAPSQ